MKSILTGQMERPYFPVSLEDLPNCLEFHEFSDHPFSAGPVSIRSTRLRHPGVTFGFRIECGGRALVYATDQEPHPSGNGGEPSLDPALLQFAAGADLLICDAQYTPEEYRERVGWGHSSVTDAVRLAHAAGVGRLTLFHHDPERSDEALDALLDTARAEARRLGGPQHCLMAAEGLRRRR